MMMGDEQHGDEPGDAEATALELVRAEQLHRSVQIDAIAEAFSALPIPPGPGATGLPWRSLIPRHIPRQILGLNRVPRTYPPDGQARAALVRSVDSTIGSLEDVSPRVLAAIKTNLPDPALNELTLLLHRLRAAAQYAEVENNIGWPKTTTAKSIAECCALHYYHLTGKKPTDTNQFGKLLKEIFDIIGVDKAEASARSRAKAVAREWQSILKQGF